MALMILNKRMKNFFTSLVKDTNQSNLKQNKRLPLDLQDFWLFRWLNVLTYCIRGDTKLLYKILYRGVFLQLQQGYDVSYMRYVN